MTKFVQIIEFQSSRIDEIKALGEQIRSERDGGTVRRATNVLEPGCPGLLGAQPELFVTGPGPAHPSRCDGSHARMRYPFGGLLRR